MSIPKQKTLIILLATALTILVLSVGAALAQSVVDWWVIAGGGGPSSGGNVILNDTLGQPIIGPSSNGSVALSAGYWYSPGLTNANLTITKAVTPTAAAPGSTITYTLTFSNAGNGTATGVVITDFVPVSVTVQSVISSGDVVITHTTSNQAVEVFETSTISGGQGGVITLTAVVTQTPVAGVITNTVYLYYASGNLSDTVSFSTISDTVAPPNPTLITPVNGSTITNTDNLTFSWSAVVDDLSGLDYYTLQVDSSEDGLSIQASSDSITTTQTVHTPTNVLANGFYTWTVRAQDKVGNVSSGLTATFTISATSSGTSIYLPIVVKNN